MSNKGTDIRRDEETDLKTRRRTKRPPMYKVIFHNDDYTTREFVVLALTRYFNKTEAEATELMLRIHHLGASAAGIYPLDIARTKKAIVEQKARQEQMPLQLSIEAEDEGHEEDEP